jgi:predicted glycosyltransferase involved in capsule biosynthesis
MNRTERLEQMLPTWAKVESIKDIVVVDWSSKIPIIESENIQKILKEFNKIKIVRVEDEKFFHICKSNNIGFRFTDKKNKILLKLDTDYVNIDESWIDYLALNKNEKDGGFRLKQFFLVGSCRFYPSTGGFLLVNKKAFKDVKGYNENFTNGWGDDDNDLYARIYDNQKKLNKFFEKIFFFDIKKYVYHIPHDDELRYCNYPQEQKLAIKNDGEWEFQKYKILSETNNYTRIKLKNKENNPILIFSKKIINDPNN